MNIRRDGQTNKLYDMWRLFYCSLYRNLTQYPEIKRELKLMLLFLHEGEKNPQLVFALCLTDFPGT